MQKRLTRSLLLTTMLSLIFTGYSCAKTEDDMTDSKPSPQKTAEQLAIRTLAEEMKLATDDIKLLSSEAVEWPNPALGCPQPDMFYPQVIVPGYKVKLQANGGNVDVHVGENRAIVCRTKTSN